MAKEKFGVAVDEEIVREVDELVAECNDLGATRHPCPLRFHSDSPIRPTICFRRAYW
jgi:hypothetical protein